MGNQLLKYISAKLFVAFVILAGGYAIHAAELVKEWGKPPHEPVDIVEFGGGYFDINDDWKTYSAHFIYKPRARIYDIFYPVMGVMATGKGAFHAFSGAGVDFYLTDNIVLSPSFAPGFYANGSGKKLGLWLQFKSMIELGYEFGNHNRVALGIYHISNANIGKTNQGTEVVTLTYSLPLTSK